jgi:3-deoxy-D-manno-octulosonate 8-phosphate phosphatase (KDO 8-P phosphatase)
MFMLRLVLPVNERLDVRVAERIRLVLLDVDGVLTDGGVYLGATADGQQVELKRFEITDQLGIKMLVWAGIEVALVSGRESAASRIRAEELGIECLQESGGHKMANVQSLMRRHGLGWDEVAFVSDDLADVPVLRRVGLPVAVANAVPEVLALARWRTRNSGGYGAVREFAETLLKSRGMWNEMVQQYLSQRAGEADTSVA